MPGAFGHLIGGWIAGKTLNLFNIRFSRVAWGALFAGAIAPDTDLLIDWTTTLNVHRTFTHSFLGVFFAGLLAFLVLQLVRRRVPQVRLAPVLFSLGILIHIMLDLTVGSSGLQVFWPDNTWITLNEPLAHIDTVPSYDNLKYWLKMMVADGALGVAWLAYLFWRKKVNF